jgi:type IV secretory pathway TrbF-like protein
MKLGKNPKITKPVVVTDPAKLDSNNPYINEIKGYLDLRSYDRVTIAAQRNIIFILMVIVLATVIGLIYIGKASKFIPMVFYTDRNGAMFYGGIATEKLEVTEPMVANQLAQYIQGLREVPKDIAVRTEDVRKVLMMSTPTLYSQIATPNFELRYKEDAPLVYIKIKNVLPLSANAYQIDWEENSDNRITTWRASISFTMDNEINDPKVRLYNPLGILVNGININQEIQ